MRMLEVAFKKSNCFVRRSTGKHLLTGIVDPILHNISSETTSSTPICFMAKASPTQAWLWHRRLSYLNFDYITLLSKKDIVTGLPKLKYVKHQICSSCEMSKAKKSSFSQKAIHQFQLEIHPENGLPSRKLSYGLSICSKAFLDVDHEDALKIAKALMEGIQIPGDKASEVNGAKKKWLKRDHRIMSPLIRRKYHDSVAFATGCKKIKKCKRGNCKIRIPIAMWPCRVEEKMTLKEVDGQAVEEIKTKIIAKDGTITIVPGKFQGYETSEEEPVEQPRRHDLYGFVDHPQLQQGNLMNEFAPHRLPRPKDNMNGWLIENEEEVERDEVDSDLKSTASSKPVWQKTTEDDHDRASRNCP
ncbi:retrovirus-related pol polyprotein from transposon TNT 1-94 [Tanacetum coccineum]